VIADCDNVQRGERVVYDVKTGKAMVHAGATGRVQGIFTPGGDDKQEAGGGQQGVPHARRVTCGGTECRTRCSAGGRTCSQAGPSAPAAADPTVNA